MKTKISLKKLLKSILPGIAVAFTVCFMLFFYAPFELYITNHKEFWFTSGQMLPIALVMFFASFLFAVACLAFARIKGRKIYTIMSAAALVVMISCYVQGNFMVKNLPSLNGTQVEWGAYPSERIKTIVLWLAVSALVFLLLKLLGHKNFNTVAGLAGLALGLVLLVTITTLFVGSSDQSKNVKLIANDKNMYTVSEDENFLVIVLDGIDACAFEEILYAGKGYEELFKDFTYYDNTLGGYPYSLCSEGLYLTGDWYEADKSFEEYISEGLTGAPFYEQLDAAGYTRGLYNDDTMLMEGIPEGFFENLSAKQPDVASQLVMAKMMLKMTIIKYAPWDLKVYGYDLFSRMNENKAYSWDDGYNYFNSKNIAVYDAMKDENPFVIGDGRYAKFIHLEGAHEPHIYDAQLNISEDATYRTCIEAALFTFSAYLERLQEIGAYDCSSIIVMSDHGLANPNDEVLDTLQQHPILLIKGRNESKDELTVDNAPISFGDLHQAYSHLLEGSSGQDVFDWKAGDSRERRFIWYGLHLSSDFTEYIQTGQAEDMDTLVPSGRVFKPFA